ncbi:MAG: short chain dehydrogenase [Acidimicrobiales bacterium]|nr:short chain dehydrogenase [Acidimicrobiales bacterium]
MTDTAKRPATLGHGLLEGKVVVVTAGAGTGIGYATARRCAEEGATVVLSDRHPVRLDVYARELAEIVGRAVPSIVCDVTVQQDVERLFDFAEAQAGPIDVLVNNAALGGTCDVRELSDDQWSDILDVTLTGTFRCTRAALRQMCPRGSGSIVNISSVVAWRAEAGQGAYGAAKAGVLALTRAAALEAAPSGVRVNAVVPSLALHPNLAKVSSDEHLANLAAKEAFGRSAEPWEIANVVVFLASDLASYLTGESISVSSQHP